MLPPVFNHIYKKGKQRDLYIQFNKLGSVSLLASQKAPTSHSRGPLQCAPPRRLTLLPSPWYPIVGGHEGDSTCRLQQGAWTPQHYSGRQLETHTKQPDAGLDWILIWSKTLDTSFCLGLLRTRLDFSHDETDRDGTLGCQEGNPLNFTSSIKFTEPHPSMWVSGNSFPLDTARIHFPTTLPFFF